MNNNELAAQCLIEAANILSGNNMNTMTESILPTAKYETKYRDIIEKFNNGDFDELGKDKDKIKMWVMESNGILSEYAANKSKNKSFNADKIRICINSGILVLTSVISTLIQKSVTRKFMNGDITIGGVQSAGLLFTTFAVMNICSIVGIIKSAMKMSKSKADLQKYESTLKRTSDKVKLLKEKVKDPKILDELNKLENKLESTDI
jgi:hypothetical protein